MIGINVQDLKDFITSEMIISLLKELGSETYLVDNKQNMLFQTVCHGGDSHKLYYYPSTGTFHCFTGCSESFDIINLVMKTKSIGFQESLYFISGFVGFSQKRGFVLDRQDTDDWDILEKYKIYATEEQSTTLEEEVFYNEKILNYYKTALHDKWADDGITRHAVDKFEIKFDEGHNRIIIPHRNISGELIGIRVRNLESWAVDNGLKYMPLMLQDNIYSHPTGAHLYGLFQNLETIQKVGKIVIFESEKSVLQCESFYPNNNFSVATCGSAISNTQRNIILNLGIKEVIIAFDKEFEEILTPESDLYSSKLMKVARKFSPYFQTFVVWDSLKKLDYKDSPSDKGKQTLEELMKNKIEVSSAED